MKIFKHFDDLT
jgi:hypothetical protein